MSRVAAMLGALLLSLNPFGAQGLQEAPTIALESGSTVEREFDGEDIHSYMLNLGGAPFLRLVLEQLSGNMALTLVGPHGDVSEEVDDAYWGDFEVLQTKAAEPGIYRLQVRSLWGAGARYSLRFEARTAEQQASFEERRLAEARAAGDWIRQNLIPLTTVEPGHGFADLEPLRTVVGDARIVGLGEATHGSREFFQLKHRIFEFLVTEMGFNVFAIEANMAEAMAINRYVLTGDGDPDRALAGLQLWPWDTEEVLALIEWMRRYNADPEHSRKVKFYGVDAQNTPRAARVTLDYLQEVDPAVAIPARETLEPALNPYRAWRLVGLPPTRLSQITTSIQELARTVDSRREEYIARSSETEWELARRHLQALAQALYLRIGGTFADGVARNLELSNRDRSMAENLAWALEHEGRDSKAVYWAHNYHVSTTPGAAGTHLQEMYGDQFRAFGFSFDRGQFQARNGGGDGTLRAFRVGPAPPGSIPGQFAATGVPIAALDLRALPDTGLVAGWFGSLQARRFVGSGFNENNPDSFWQLRPVPDVFDALLFVGETTAARSTPTGRRGPSLPPIADAPVNLSFEDGLPGEWPAGWIQPDGIARVEWNVEISREDAVDGVQALTIERDSGPVYGETSGGLRQKVDATPYRGSRVTFRASVRIEDADPAASKGYLWLQVTRPAEPWSVPVLSEYMDDRPITAGDWREYEITADVPDEADVIWIGIAFVGPGRAWVDDVAIEGERGL